MSEPEIQKRIGEPMTNFDLEKYLEINPSDIIKYSELSDYHSIEQLLPKKDSFKVLLIEDKTNSGHFVGLFRFDKTIEYFNSYGAKWDTDWRFIPRMVRIILGQATNDLTRLFTQAKKDGFNVVWNKKRLQKLSPTIQTCGRFVAMRRHLGQMGYTLPQFQKEIENLRDKNTKKGEKRKTADWVVSKYIA
mgnify:CR=1 FL=1|tara:strand:- start:1185 stop:1754 length:570 start_codon:yes stop_codon:yes gene_type:complete